ncbi:MAG: tRNA (adenosine(37)-N6)-dimethylallyltransferase MiaA [Clostridia bacterium]|nr:tRNA (adenosine(37)-N6)-dimethylallyltransferase MiaA [Clostridia bacterium]
MVQKNSIDNKIIIICGPTASNKSALSMELAKLLDTEIISADSLNVYKKLDIGTAKPSKTDRETIRHHLIDVADPDKTFSVGDYREIALPIVKRIISENKIPIICGGTGFYINSILYNYSYGNINADLNVRSKYLELAKEKGNLYVYNILKEKDNVSAEKLHFNDVKRVVRALEICENGTKKSEIIDELIPNFNYCAFSIDFDRDELYNRINKRVDLMIESGLVNEVQSLIESGITIDNQCMQGIGYKEIYGYLNGELSLSEAVNLIKLNTRHYAKRQITFFKKLPDLVYLKPDDPKILARRIIDLL